MTDTYTNTISGMINPNMTITTYNVNSLSAYATTAAGKRRKYRIVKYINNLLKNNDIIMLQETKLLPKDKNYFRLHFGDCLSYTSNHTATSAGVAILIKRTFAENYTINARTTDNMAGRLLCLDFNGRPPYRSFSLINVYLPAGTSMLEKTAALKNLDSLICTCLTFVGGDFNFVETSKEGPTTLSGEAKRTWDDLTNKHGLWEIRQGANTYGGAKDNAARLDRFYTSYEQSEISVAAIYAYVLKPPIHTAGQLRKSQTHEDHRPVTARLGEKTPTKKRAFNCPVWLATEPTFKALMHEEWINRGRSIRDPYQRLRHWKNAIKKATKAYFYRAKRERLCSQELGARLARGLAMLRLLSKPDQDRKAIIQLATTDRTLGNMLEKTETRLYAKGLREAVNDMIDSYTARDTNEEEPTSVTSALDLIRAGAPKKANLLKTLKDLLPNDRKRLHAMRATGDSEPTTDPNAMARMILDNWGGKWTHADEDATLQTNYLKDLSYEKKLPKGHTYEENSVDDYVELIAESNDSCAGPDGIPFAFYRAFTHKVAPILSDIEKELRSGRPPPRHMEFNYARLFLIPKKGTMLPMDHRPIAVTNADNRLVAAALVRTITPPLKAFLHPAQNGFVPGRQGERNILDITNHYYSRLTRKQQTFILFLDIEKAFDSIHHSFIMRMLERVGFPSEIITAIKLLLEDVHNVPVLSEDTGCKIPVRRGVKQGCPLSPLLFVLCYDPVLCALSGEQDIIARGYADDLAAAASTLEKAIKVFKIFRKYGAASGMKMNKGKSKMLTAEALSKRQEQQLLWSGYAQVERVTKATYLGVLIGKVSTAEIYDKALSKFKKRVLLYANTLKRMSIHRRIITFNVFLLPLFYYLAQFYIVPPDVYREVKEICRKRIIPYGGTAFAYTHLVTPNKTGLGFSRPLKDLWATNMTILAAKANLSNSHNLPLAIIPGYTHVNAESWGMNDGYDSMRIGEHRAHAAYVYLDDYGKRCNGLIQSEKLADDPKSRREIYLSLASQGWASLHDDPDKLSLTAKLKKWGVYTPNAVSNMMKHAKTGTTLRACIWNHHLRMVYNALPFDRRLRHTGLLEGEPRACLFCGQGMDCCFHVYNDCQVVERARIAYHEAIGFESDAWINDFLLIEPYQSEELTKATLVFNYAVWTTRRDVLDAADRQESWKTLLRMALSTKATPERDNNRSKELGDYIARAKDPNYLLLFTDGSASPNPGPAGAGLYLPDNTLEEQCYYAPLGHSTNNAAELYAVGMALTLVLDSLMTGELPYDQHVVLLTDSNYVIAGVVKGRRTKRNNGLLRKVRAKYRQLQEKTTVDLVWVKGHSNIFGNEMADRAANEGTRRSRRDNDDALLRKAVTDGVFQMYDCDPHMLMDEED